MSTHDHGNLYQGWQRMESGISQLQQEIAVSQVVHVTEQYQPGSERLEKLYESMALAQRFQQPSSLEFNV